MSFPGIDHNDLVPVCRKVEVRFFVPGSGPVRETYDLGRAEHLIAWSINERLSAAIQTGIRDVETVRVPKPMARQMMRSRAGMKPYIDRRMAEVRQRITRAAGSGQ
jgi:hypothetical protein